ncbi:hypothetical protein ACRQ5B_05845 [Pseudarthrobacter sp. L19]|uniref:hypothetical protein n=1 Tax=Pseudarthrobacter sp. L19 TaxID=3423951 RepID=UPI003D78DF22
MPFPAMFAVAGLWQLLALTLVVAVGAAGSASLARKHHADPGTLPDAVFWDVFAGVAVVAPAVLLGALASPAAGLMLATVAVASAVASLRWTPAFLRRQRMRRDSRRATADDAAAAARHGEVLARWQRYELDPALCIDYPQLSDARHPETSALFKAMRRAELLRPVAGRGGSGGLGGTAGLGGPGRADGPSYSDAVARLETALAEAERSAGALGQPRLSPGSVQ